MTLFRIPRFARAGLAALAIAVTLGTSTASADIVVRRDGSKAVDVPAVPAPASSDSGDGLDPGNAAVGAAGLLTLALGTAGVFWLRGNQRPRSTP